MVNVLIGLIVIFSFLEFFFKKKQYQILKIQIDYSCNCTGTGFEGSKCDIEINECLSNPCRNYGECVDLTNNYLCNCKNGFSGSVSFFFFSLFF